MMMPAIHTLSFDFAIMHMWQHVPVRIVDDMLDWLEAISDESNQ